MKKRKTIRGFFALLGLLMGVTSIGFSSWLLEKADFERGVTITKSAEVAVCYNNKTNVKYTTIEKALQTSSSGQTIYVYPDLKDSSSNLKEIHITENCTIPSGVTLALPYSGTTTLTRTEPGTDNGFADGDASKVKANRATQVIVDENVTITNNGSLIVGAELYEKNQQAPMAHAGAKYAEITMSPSSLIENYGTIECYGYIKETANDNGSKINNYPSSSTTTVFVIYDYRGGSYSARAYNSDNVMPVNAFDMPNIRSEQTFQTGSKLIGTTMMYGTGYVASPMVIGNSNDSLFVLSSGSVSMKHCPVNCLYTTNDVKSTTTSDGVNRTKIAINGNISINKLVLKVGSYQIDTSSMVCPIPQKFQIVCESGSISINNAVKFLSGSSLTINEGATLTINAKTVFYQGYVPNITTASHSYPKNLGTARLIVAGRMEINKDFGGLIEVAGENAQLVVASGLTNSITTTETLTGSSLGMSGTNEKHTETGQSYFGTDSKPSSSSALEAGDFSSGGDFWKVELKPITGLSLSPSTATSSANTKLDQKITASYTPSVTNCTDISFSWTCDKGNSCLSATTGQTVTLSMPANSGSSDVKYKVECTINFKYSDGSAGSFKASGEYIAAKQSSSECYTGDTEIMMADGSIKLAKDVHQYDLVKTFDHNTGRISVSPVAYVYYNPEHETNRLTVRFHSGRILKIVDHGHCVFDIKANEYINLMPSTIDRYLGRDVYCLDGDGNRVIDTIESYNIDRCIEAAYSIITAYDINCFANGLLNVSDDIEGLYNYFELDENMKVDEAKKQRDIELYGLATYEEWSDYCTEEEFEVFNCQYLNIAIGKGLTTRESLIERMLRFTGKSA